MAIKNFKNSGYALYTSIILTGVLMLVAYVTANISIKSLLISVSIADSHIAFYNADSGLECALYWDLKNSGGISAFDINTPGSINCNNQNISSGSQTVQTKPPQASRIGGGGLGNPSSIFQLDFNPGCAIVIVTKNSDFEKTTTIQSRGYNSCTTNKRLERGVQIQY